MVIQTITRKVSGLLITSLELNTLAHVLCAVAMYATWWKKPQNVSDPLEVNINLVLAAVVSKAPLLGRFSRSARNP